MLDAADIGFDAFNRRLLLAGNACDRDVIEEAARALEHGGQALCIGGGRAEADRCNPGAAQRRAQFLIFLGRDVDADHPIDARPHGRIREPFWAAPDHRVGIAHQDQWHIGVTRAEVSRDLEDVCGFGSGAQAAQVRFLNRGAIGHWISEGHSQLDHIRAGFDQRIEIGRGVAITCGDEADECWMRL